MVGAAVLAAGELGAEGDLIVLGILEYLDDKVGHGLFGGVLLAQPHMGDGAGFDQGMEAAFQLYPLDGIHARAHVEQGGVGIVDLVGEDVALDHMAGLVGMELEVQLGKAVGGAFGRGLLQHKAHVVLISVVFAQEVHLGDYLEAEAHAFFSVVQFLAHVVLHHLVETHHAHQIGDPVHAQIRLSVQIEGQERQGTGHAVVQKVLDEIALSQMGLGGQADALAQDLEQLGVVAASLIGDAG